jgi:hypothetical protein
MSCLLAAGAARSMAQEAVNVVQELTFKLTGYYQKDDTENNKKVFRHAGKVSVSNKDIINLLEGPTGQVFAPDAILILLSGTPVDRFPRVAVREKSGGDVVDTDVTQYFGAERLASIEDGQINKDPIKANGVSYDVLVFKMQVPDVAFQVQGFGKTTVSTGKFEGDPAAIVHTGKLNVSGAGEYQVTLVIGVVRVALTGTVTITGNNVKAVAE